MNFNFRPYTLAPRWIAKIELYIGLGGSAEQISNDEVPMNILTWLAIIFLTLLPFITESAFGAISYKP